MNWRERKPGTEIGNLGMGGVCCCKRLQATYNFVLRHRFGVVQMPVIYRQLPASVLSINFDEPVAEF